MATENSAPSADGTSCTFHEAVVELVGSADDLVADGLILREWLPVPPKRLVDWLDARTRLLDLSDWDHDRDAVLVWRLRDCGGGRYRMQIVPRHYKASRDGPIDHDAPRRALARHRALVRARGDAAFRRFLARCARSTT